MIPYINKKDKNMNTIERMLDFCKAQKFEYHGTATVHGFDITKHGNKHYLISKNNIFFKLYQSGFLGNKELFIDFINAIKTSNLKTKIENSLTIKTETQSKRVKI